MGTALVRGWAAKRISPITVVEPEPSNTLVRLARGRLITLEKTMSNIRQDEFRTCVIAIKPQVLKNTARVFINIAVNEATMISIAAGIRTDWLRSNWGPASHVVRAMPNTPGAIGKGITGIFAATGTNADDRKIAEILLSALGEVIWVGTENEIDAVTAVSGSGPAYVFLLAEALEEAARAEGIPRHEAEKLARATVAGAGALLSADDDAASLREAVTSPGGTTEAALKVLMAEDGLAALMKRAVHAARKRAEELR